MEYQSSAVSPVESIQEGWDIIKNDYWLFFGMTAVAIVLLIIIALILSFINGLIVEGIALAMGMATKNAANGVKVGAALAPQIISLVTGFFVNVIVGTLSGAFFCGIYSALSRKVNTGAVEFGDMFSGFQKLVPCLIVSILLGIIHFVYSLVMVFVGAAVGFTAFTAGGLLGSDGKPNMAVLGSLLGIGLVFLVIAIIFNLILSALTTFVYPLIAERDLSGGQALAFSAKGGLANLIGMILLVILVGLMGVGGALVFCIGFLFVAPISVASIFAAYRKVFGSISRGGFQTPPPPPNFGY